MLDRALELAAKGFRVFPCQPNGKLPMIEGYPVLATTDPDEVREFWTDPLMGWVQPYNIGVSTNNLLVVDIDEHKGKEGYASLEALKLSGLEVPETLTILTPTGGGHMYYSVEKPIKQGGDVFGEGLDVRGKGGYVVGPGSEIDGKAYEIHTDKPIVPAPKWMVDKCGKPTKRQAHSASIDQLERVHQGEAYERAAEYLGSAEIAIEGQNGDHTTFEVCARVKDFGLTEENALEVLLDHWNDRCEPPWDAASLQVKIANAYRYGKRKAGADAPELVFEKREKRIRKEDIRSMGSSNDGEKLHPFQELNREYAFVVQGGSGQILWETLDAEGNPDLQMLSLSTFHHQLAPLLMMPDGAKRMQPVSELWMKDKGRRSYNGICFLPGMEAPEKFYNIWRGFSCEPATDDEELPKAAHRALDIFLEHALENVCRNDYELFQWLIGYFAHSVQKPGDKPLSCIVIKGGKGVGKNAFVDCVGNLFGTHYLSVADNRYLTGQFNRHLERLVYIVLDEAFWSGDKQADGILKHLVTGDKHTIEPKGKESYSMRNYVRPIILGNEDWLVPASADERRYCVFDVGDKRKQDRKYFHALRTGMEAGGNRLLLQYLLEYEIDGLDVNWAPETDALLEQKIESLPLVESWWYQCLVDAEIAGSDVRGEWPDVIEKDLFREAFRRYLQGRSIRARAPSDQTVGKRLGLCCPGLQTTRTTIDKARVRAYSIPPLKECRKKWDKFIGHTGRWESEK